MHRGLSSESKGTTELKDATWQDLKPQRRLGGALSMQLNISENLIVISCMQKGRGEAGFPGNCVFGAKITGELGTALLSSE